MVSAGSPLIHANYTLGAIPAPSQHDLEPCHTLQQACVHDTSYDQILLIADPFHVAWVT